MSFSLAHEPAFAFDIFWLLTWRGTPPSIGNPVAFDFSATFIENERLVALYVVIEPDVATEKYPLFLC